MHLSVDYIALLFLSVTYEGDMQALFICVLCIVSNLYFFGDFDIG